MTLQLSTTEDGGRVTLAPAGDIDLNVSGEFQQALREALSSKPTTLVVDLTHVPYMDSSGVATLVDAMQVARGQQSRLILCCLQEKVRSIFEITRLDRVFTIAATADEAADL